MNRRPSGSRVLRDAGRRGGQLNLTEDEIAFCDAPDVKASAVKVRR